ncbi:MAG: CinA family nicotinamide mononucleotide deamidase-related protein [Bacteroidales bacterium]|nr:CinA family nicotinamide mononucleotide deamidase-related protein [Candidatus Cryptobacteroides onthequi]
MNKASICTIGDEILIGQIVDTNSSEISRALNGMGIQVTRMISIGDRHEAIVGQLGEELSRNDIVIVTGGLGPTKDDITKAALAELSGSRSYVENSEQKEIVVRILHSRGLDVLDINLQQAMVPDSCEVIPNRLGTAPIMAFHFPEERFGHKCSLYSLPGVPYEAVGMLPDVLADIKSRFNTSDIYHQTIMTYGMAESALAKKIEAWEDALPEDMHLAYLPNLLTGVRLRLSIYGGERESQERRISERFSELRQIIGDVIYAEEDTTIEAVIGILLKGSGRTLAAAESCTGGMISHMITSVPGASEYYLGSVTSYAVDIKNRILGVPLEVVEKYGIVSSQVAAAMAEGVRAALGSTYSVATTGWADSYGDEREPAGTVWVAVSGPSGTLTSRFNYKNSRKLNISRFAASALNELRKYIVADIK